MALLFWDARWRYNADVIDLPAFYAAVTALQAEVVDDPNFGLLPVSDTTIFASMRVS